MQVLHLRNYNYSDENKNQQQAREQAAQEFAQWAFATDGIPSLQIIAVGDFSYTSRFSTSGSFLCKNSQPARALSGLNYRTITEVDQQLWELIDRYWNALTACPPCPVLSYDR